MKSFVIFIAVWICLAQPMVAQQATEPRSKLQRVEAEIEIWAKFVSDRETAELPADGAEIPPESIELQLLRLKLCTLQMQKTMLDHEKTMHECEMHRQRLEAQNRELREDLEEAKNSTIGTIVPFAGPLDNANTPAGWVLCDGRSLLRDGEFAGLFKVIGTAWGAADDRHFNVPDLRGQFLRGVSKKADLKDPDVEARSALYSGGNTGANVGSYQSFSTAVPKKGFQGEAEPNGIHSHSFTAVVDTGSPWGMCHDNDATMSSCIGLATSESGIHRHRVSVSGGDSESRPDNVYVNYIVHAK